MILNALVEKLKRRSKDDFKGRHFEAMLILQAVSWYLRYPLSYRDIEELFRERGLEVDHSGLMGLPTRGQASDVMCLVLPRERSAMPQEAARWRRAPVPLVASWPTLAHRARPPARSGARGDPSDLRSLRGS